MKPYGFIFDYTPGVGVIYMCAILYLYIYGDKINIKLFSIVFDPPLRGRIKSEIIDSTYIDRRMRGLNLWLSQ